MTLTKNTETQYEIMVSGENIGYVEYERGGAGKGRWRAAIYNLPIWGYGYSKEEAATQAIIELLS